MILWTKANVPRLLFPHMLGFDLSAPWMTVAPSVTVAP